MSIPGRKSDKSLALNLRVGEVVQVRSVEEILSTLDENGTLEALPFMPEMLQYCGRRFRVFKTAHKTCDTIGTKAEDFRLRKMNNTVHLEGLRCDGDAHGGCQAGCLIFWKEAWLKRMSTAMVTETALRDSRPAVNPECPGAQAQRCTLKTLTDATRAPADLKSPQAERFSCQATELRKASSYLAWWDLRPYFRDVWFGNVTLGEVMKGIAIWAFNRIQRYRGGGAYPLFFRLRGHFPLLEGKQKGTPTLELNLQPGELVKVKSREEILQTVDDRMRNRGLLFDREMAKYCGGQYRVLRRVDTIIDDKTGAMLHLPNSCIVLESVTCGGHYNFFCQRHIYPFWREIWLQRVAPEGTEKKAETADAAR